MTKPATRAVYTATGLVRLQNSGGVFYNKNIVFGHAYTTDTTVLQEAAVSAFNNAGFEIHHVERVQRMDIMGNATGEEYILGVLDEQAAKRAQETAVASGIVLNS